MTYQRGEILFNKYRLEALAGQGAFGEVWQVTHLELDAPRALKILRRDAPGLGSTEYAEFFGRFRLEAQLGDQLKHPNIVRTFDFEKDDQTLALVMDYAPNGNLAILLKHMNRAGARMPIQQAVKITLEIAQGLAAIHAMDIIHRDLKPTNILFNNKREAQIADLGLAQIPGGPSRRSQMSNPVPHPGTPGYMSPEQENTRGYLKPPSDVYSLGLVVFEMLTGRNFHHLRPDTRVSTLRKDVPAWLDDLLAKMLAADPVKRPWDGAEVVRLLQEGLASNSPKAADTTPLNQKLPLRAAAIGLGILVLLVFVGLVIKSWLDATPNVTESSQRSPGAIPLPSETVQASATNTIEPTSTPTLTITPTYTPTPTLTITPTYTHTWTPAPPTSTPTPARPEAFITEPDDGDRVGYEVAISGVISGLRSGMRAFVCIQSQAYGMIYPQAEIFPDQDGRWVVTGYYATVGADYATYVVVTTNQDSAELLADLYYRAYGIAELPAETSIISPIIIVTRQ